MGISEICLEISIKTVEYMGHETNILDKHLIGLTILN